MLCTIFEAHAATGTLIRMALKIPNSGAFCPQEKIRLLKKHTMLQNQSMIMIRQDSGRGGFWGRINGIR